jgi:hypothetical protein
MAHGGYRPGAGRPKGSGGTKHSKSEDGYPIDVVKAASKAKMTPLEYMLTVMCNPEADRSRRDRMAIAAAPFCHARPADSRVGKKDAQDAEARKAGGEDWNEDLLFEGGRVNGADNRKRG